jgi:YjbE family integral membrane protein
VDVGLLQQIGSIILIDLVLSGDNAVVIGMASRRLPPEQRKKAIIWGGGGAVVLRIIFTILAALLLDIPLLMAAGGILLLYIAIKLIIPHAEHAEHVKEAGTMGEAIRTIILADAVMSLDNMLAVGGAAHGHIWLLLFGLALSIPILLLGSSAIARLIDKYPWVNLIGAAVLVHTALAMFFEDERVHEFIHFSRTVEWEIEGLTMIAVVIAGLWLERRMRRANLAHSIVVSNQKPFNVARDE